MKYAFFLIGVTLFVGWSIGEKTEKTELLELLQVMEQMENDVEEWVLYTNGSFGEIESEKSFVAKQKEIEATIGAFEWEKCNKEDDDWKWCGYRKHETLPFDEYITMTSYPTGTKQTLYLIYEIKGKTTQRHHLEELVSFVREREGLLFSKEQKWFTMVKGTSKKTNNLYDEGEKVLNLLSAKEIEALREETFVSISAYTNDWSEAIETNGQEMNVQVALRQGLGSATTVTIGTPIITTEY